MNSYIYILSGLSAAFIGALPPGAVNLSVVYTTLNKGAKFTVSIILAAAIGEITLSYFALHFTMMVEEYVSQNIWLQYLIAIILLVAGGYLITTNNQGSPPKKLRRKNYGFLKGLLLSVINPPVLVFWLVAFGYISAKTNIDLLMDQAHLIALFFTGVFLGKIAALCLYVHLSKRIARKAGNVKDRVNKGIGLVLAIIALVQLGKLTF